MTAAATYDDWSGALLAELLPVLPTERTGQAVLLACDDGAVRAAAQTLDVQAADPGAEFGTLVETKFRIARDGSPDSIRRQTRSFRVLAQEPDAIPPFFGAACALVLAASRMTTDDAAHTVNYYDRLWTVLGRRPRRSGPYDFSYLPHLFAQLACWLAGELGGVRGHLHVAQGGPPHVGYPINQCLFRERDKEHLAEFFAERVGRRHRELDLLRLLQVSSDRHHLTHRARHAIATPELADLARAALTHAFQTWDGSRPDPRGGGSWLATLHLSVNRGFKLSISAPDAAPGLALGGGRTLEDPAFDLVTLSGAEFAELATRGLRWGPANAKGIYLPVAGETLIFEVREDTGLVWVAFPAADHVYVLTRSSGLQRRLAAYASRLPGTSAPPRGWNLFERVPAGQLPEGVTDLSAARPPVSLTGGLRIGRRQYLTGRPPRVEVGDVDEPLTILVDDAEVAELAAGQDLQLDLTAGEHTVDVGGVVRWSFHMLDRNPARPEYGQLAYPLTDRGVRAGATAASQDVCVRGALLSEPYDGDIPLMLRAGGALVVDADGSSTTIEAPNPPLWVRRVGLDPTGARWEADLSGDPAWIITAYQAVAIRPQAPTQLDARARAAVDLLAGRAAPRVRSLYRRDRDAAYAAFAEMATTEPEPRAEA